MGTRFVDYFRGAFCLLPRIPLHLEKPSCVPPNDRPALSGRFHLQVRSDRAIHGSKPGRERYRNTSIIGLPRYRVKSSEAQACYEKTDIVFRVSPYSCLPKPNQSEESRFCRAFSFGFTIALTIFDRDIELRLFRPGPGRARAHVVAVYRKGRGYQNIREPFSGGRDWPLHQSWTPCLLPRSEYQGPVQKVGIPDRTRC